MAAISLVITERLTRQAWSDPGGFQHVQAEFDRWLRQRGAAFMSVRHYRTLVGEPLLETWLEYPNYSALEHDQHLLKQLEHDRQWARLHGRLFEYLERVSSRVVEQMPASLAPE